MTTLAQAHFAIAPDIATHYGPHVRVSAYGSVYHYRCHVGSPTVVRLSHRADDDTYDLAAKLAEQHAIPLVVYDDDIPF